MSNIQKIVLCTCAFFKFFVTGETVDELKQKYAEIIMLCANDFPLTATDLEMLKAGQLSDDQNIKCLFACAYKKIGMMDDKGQLSVDGVQKITQNYFAADPAEVMKANEFTQACSSVNQLPVSDGEKGCDRAALILKCTIEKAPEFGFV